MGLHWCWNCVAKVFVNGVPKEGGDQRWSLVPSFVLFFLGQRNGWMKAEAQVLTD